MTNETAPDPSANRAVLQQSLRGSIDLLRGSDVSFEQPIDTVDSLLSLAWFDQYQLGVLVSLVGAVQPGDVTVADVIDTANGFDPAASAAVGAAASLLSLVRDGDEAAVGRGLSEMLARFDDAELVAASSALSAALTINVARALNLAPLKVQQEMVDAIVGNRDGSALLPDSGTDVTEAPSPAPTSRPRPDRHAPYSVQRHTARRGVLRHCMISLFPATAPTR